MADLLGTSSKVTVSTQHEDRRFVISLAPLRSKTTCIEVIDTKTGKVSLRRTIKMTSLEETRWTTVSIGETTAITLESPNMYQVGKRLRIRLVSDHNATFSDDKAITLYIPSSILNQTVSVDSVRLPIRSITFRNDIDLVETS